jgi:N-acyl homoserine lactone hydrolase
VKVFSLRLGATKVPFGQFYGGLHGWRGLSALYRYATDKGHFIVVPIHAYLIDHPHEGLILVDAGINWRQAHEHGQYYKGIAHYLFDDDEYQLDRSEELPAALGQLGYRLEDVRRVVVTHLHEDHVGGLAYLPNAEVIVSRDEWVNRGWKLFGFIPMVYQPSLQPTRTITQIGYEDGPFESFQASHDLTADGAVKILPTPGHSPGHLCVLVQLDGYQLLITGDCLYTLRHLANDDVQAFGAGDWVSKQNASIKRIAELKGTLPDLVLVPGHDHTAYQFEHLEPGLAKGYLTAEERARIRQYESAIFTPEDRLRSMRRPHYIPGGPPDYIGSVTE